MKIEVRFHQLEMSEALREHALRRVHVELAHFTEEVSAVTLRLSDLNGPKGGHDKRCHIELQLRGVGAINVDERNEDAYAAVETAVERAARSGGRELAKLRASRRVDAGTRKAR